MKNIAEHINLLEALLIGAEVVIQPYGSKEKFLSQVESFSETGYLIFTPEGGLKSEIPVILGDCLVWNPDREDFPKRECGVSFPVLVFSLESGDGSKETQVSCNWHFREPELKKCIDEAIERILFRTGFTIVDF